MHNQIISTAIQFNLLILLLPLSMAILFFKPNLRHEVLAIFLGILVAYIDQPVNEVQLPVFLILAFGFFIGFSETKRPWMFSLLFGIWVPLFQITKITLLQTWDVFIPEGLGSLLALMFTFAGVYSGVLLRRMANRSPNISIGEQHVS